MRLFLFLFLAAMTYYVAGIYHSLSLMLLFVMEILLYIVMFLLPYYLKKGFFLEFLKQQEAVETGQDAACIIGVVNRARLPISRFSIQLCIWYNQDEKRMAKKLYGGVKENGKENIEFLVTTPYCGLLSIEIKKAAIYDYFSFFAAKKKIKKEMKIAVFPKEQILHLEMPMPEYKGINQAEVDSLWKSGTNHQEIRQIREYQLGDPIRMVHWNLSARTDQLWLKEYEVEQDNCFYIFLDMSISKNIGIKERDIFYKAFSALAFGLFYYAAYIVVYWNEREYQSLQSIQIEGKEGIRNLLLHLYQIDNLEKELSAEKKKEEMFLIEKGSLFKLNLKRELYYQNRFLFRFSKKKFEKEIVSGRYAI
ncbi:MAG: DUF58 domain-containing protein [Lachnospiraceae bacterium]|nr:DUF58 domain-containing protein [Lachnospiraceae bacterium]